MKFTGGPKLAGTYESSPHKNAKWLSAKSLAVTCVMETDSYAVSYIQRSASLVSQEDKAIHGSCFYSIKLSTASYTTLPPPYVYTIIPRLCTLYSMKNAMQRQPYLCAHRRGRQAVQASLDDCH